MIKIGIFSKTFMRSQLKEVFEAAKNLNFQTLHFNFTSAGLESMPAEIPDEVILQIREVSEFYQMPICGVSGTYNMCHPDAGFRKQGLERLEVLAKHCAQIGTNLISLCTGTRHPSDQWAYHPDNSSPEAWKDMSESMEGALKIAEKYEINLGVEPELTNIVSTTPLAKQLLDEMGSKRLKIILDPANLSEEVKPEEIKKQIDFALNLLGDSLVMAHAKDRDASGKFTAPGLGILPFKHLITQLKTASLEIPWVAHGFDENWVKTAADFMHRLLD